MKIYWKLGKYKRKIKTIFQSLKKLPTPVKEWENNILEREIDVRLIKKGKVSYVEITLIIYNYILIKYSAIGLAPLAT